MKKAVLQPKSQNRFRCKVVATAVAACFAADIAFANPTGPVVVNGQVSFARAGSVLSVTNSPSSIINWQQFSIAGGETTRFIQQSAASAVLNRVVGVDPSSILGTLQSNGRVFLINPSGIMFGAGSQIDVAGLVASTLRLSNEDFLAGRMNFVADPALAAAVVNQGRISASPGGQVYLVGTAVDNQGVITAPNGDIVLAAGNSVRVTDGAGSRLQVEIRAPADSTVNLSEAVYGSRGIYGGLVRNSGTISANSVVRTADGRIVLKSSGDVTLAAGSSTTANGASGGTVTIAAGGMASVSGAVEAKGDAGSGGRVEISGDLTGLFDGARVNASGTTGGGTVLVGGDYQGSNPDVQNAERTYVGPNVEIRADALESGDGGRVIVWADDVTRYFGSISARGGARSGNGGFVEVSGHESLIFRGMVDASAPNGLPGRVLLDPKDIIIANGGADAADSASNAFAVNPTGTVTIDESVIEAIIVAGTAVTLQANNDITVNEAITLAASAGTDGTLTLQAGRSVLINQGITGTDGALVIRANSTVADGVVDANRDAGAAAITMANGVTINTGSGNITLAMSTGPTTNNTSGDITISNLSTTGNVLISQGGQTAGSSILRTGTSLITAATVALDVSDAANTTGVIGTTGSRIATTTTNLEARTQGGDIFISETNALVIGGAALGGLVGINAGTGNVTLAAGGTVTQTEAITAGTLTLEGAAQTFTLSGAGNAITTLDADNSALTALNFREDSGFDVAGINATGAVTLNSVGGTVTQSGAIAATTLTLQGAGGTFTLNGVGNAITTLDANNTTLAALSFKEDSGFAVAGINTTGNTTLESVGGTVTQSAVIAAAGLELLGAGGTYTLNTQVNAVTTLAGNTGTVAFQDNTGFAIGTVNTAGLTATTAATLTSTGTVTQTQPITTPTLTLTGAAGTFTLNTQNNAVTTLDANNSALTALAFQDNTGFDVAGINVTGNATLSSTGTVTQSAVIAAAGLELLGAGGTYTLNTQVNAVTTLAGNTGTVAFQDNTGFAIGTVNTAGLTATTAATLTSTGTVTQTQPITTPTLTLTGAAGTFTLSGAGNAITTLDANNTALTALNFREDSGFDVAGINATGAVTLNSVGGTVTQSGAIAATTLTLQGAGGTFTLNGVGNAITTLDANNTTLAALSFKEDSGFAVAGITTTGNTTLESVGGTVTQTAAITASTLTLTGAAGTFTLSGAGNAITTLDADNSALTALNFREDSGFDVAGINATGAVTLNSVGGTVTQSGAIAATTLTLQGAGGTFTLNGVGNAITTLDANNTTLAALSFKEDSGFAVAGINTTGNTTLESVGGTVTQSAVIAAAGLELLGAGGTYTLNTQVNAVTTLAGNTGTVAFQDNTGFAIGTVNTAGLTATTAATLTSTGTVTQTQPITTPTLTLTGAAGTFTLNTQNNAVTTLDANNSALTALAFQDNTGFDVAGINATGAVTLDSAGAVTQSAVISGAGTLSKQGSGTLTLSLANTYTGTTTISAGTLSVNSIANVGGGASALGAPTTVANGTIALGAGTLQYTGTGHSSNRVINLTGAGTVDASGSGTLTLSGGITGAAQNLTLTGTGAGVESGVVGTTTGTLTKTGTGTWTLSGANTYAGTTAINAGTLAYGASNVIATGAVTVDGATAVLNLGNNQSDTLGTVTVANGGSITGSGTSSLTSTGSFEMQDGSVSAILAGAGIALNKTTAGTVTLSGANTYTGATTVSAGTLALGANNVLADASSVVVSGGTFDINTRTDTVVGLQLVSGSITGTTGVLTSTSNYDMRSGTASAILAGAVGLDKTTAGTVALSGANTYGGNTTISAGTLRLGAADVIPDGAGKGNVIVTGTLDLNGFSETINGLSSTGTVDNTAAATAPTLTVGNNNATGTFSGVIQNTAGTLALTKTGTGTLTLSGNNTYSGTTTVNAGTLVATNDNALGSTAGGTNVLSGATLNINNAAIGDEAISINGNGAGGVGALTGTGTASLAVAGTLTLAGASRIGTTSGASTLTLGGAVSAGGNTLDITGAGNLTATNALNNFGAVTINSSGSVSLVDANALTISALNVGTLTAQTLSGDLTLGGNITATGTGDTIVLAAAANFDNSGGFTLAPNSGGGGRWLVYSTSPAGSTEGGLTSAAGSVLPRLYNRTYSSNPPASISEPGNHLVYSFQPALTVTPNSHTKTYGQNDPAQVYGVSGYITDDGVTDNATTAGLAGSFSRIAGENVGSYLITQGSLVSNAGYDIATNFNSVGNTLAIGQAPLTFALTTPLQTKQYGDNDPAVGGIGVTLTGLVNNAAIDTWNGVGAGAVTDGAVTGTLSALTRTAGEDVGTYGALTGAVTLSASNGNYLKSFDTTNSPRLAIGQAPLTFALTTPLQTKQYGDNDPAVGGIGVTLTGLVNNAAIDTWNGVGAGAVTDGAVTGTLSALTRTAGEDVGTYGALTGAVTLSASNGNYLKSFDTTNSPRLAIGQAPLTFALTTPLQTKQYGDNDPAVGGIGVTLTGLVNNAAIDTWNGVGAGAVTDGAVTGTLSALTRTAGEDVGTYGALTGAVTLSASNGNYLKSFDTTNSPRLAIGQAPLTFALTTPLQTKQYGDNDPAVGGIGVTLTGLVNNAAIDTWNGVGAGAVTDGAVTGTLSALTRTAGEDVGTYGALTGAVTLSASNGNYLKSFDTTNSPRLAIGQAPLTFALTTPLQTKQYGDNDPAVGGIGVTLTGLVNNAAIDTWNGVGAGAVTDGAVTGTLSALTRTAGEDVGTYGALTGAVTLSASNGNYLKSFDTTNSPRLAIGQAPLTFALTTPLQTKQYGDNDPAVGGIGVTLTGLVNNAAIDTWNGVGAGAVTDGAVTGTLSALTRTAGEDVGTYGALTGAVTLSASNGNYLKSFDTTNSPRLAIGQAPLTFALTTPLQTKQYGDNDPAVGGIGVTLTGLVNNAAIDTWNGVGAGAVTDGAVTGTLSALTRTAGEDVGTYGALTGAVTLSASNGNYLKSFDTTNSPRLAIGQAPLTFALTTPLQTKQYGDNDPAVGGIGVTLTGLVNNAAIDTWNGVGAGAVTDGAVTGTLSALTRTAGEDVGTYGALTGAVTLSASNGNYLKSFDTTNSPRLAIGQAPLTFALTTPLQTKQYGDNDPAVGGIGVTLTGLVNNAAIDTWNGVGAGAVTDGAVTGTLSALTRTAGEDVGTYGALTGAVTLSASNGNYLKSFDTTNSPRLAIGQAPLTFALTTPLQTKQYGDNDPAVGGIGVTLTGLVNNAAIDTWNGVGAGAVTDGAVTGTLSALTRTAGEDVGTYGALTGAVTLSASNGNYLKSFDTTNSPRLAIGQAPLTFALTTPLQTKQYGDNDPAVGGIGVTLTGLVNNAAIDTWNGVGAGAVTDGAVTGTLSALTRTAGEDVGTYGALTGAVTLSASNGNYLKSFDTTNSPRLAIGQAPLTFALTTPLQTKQYGDNDPAVGGIGVTLTGLVNNAAIDTWNGVGAGAVTDGAVTGTLSALTRTAGEDVGTYGALTGAVTLSASNGNYLKSFDTTNSPRLAIGQAPLTFALTTPLQTKQYGDNDPAVGGIGVTLTGLVNNAAIDTWNGVGAGAVTDGAVTGTLSALTRTAGEDVGTYGALTGAVTLSASNGNYLKSFDTTNSPRLAIGQAPLTFALTTPLQTKQYGDNDPAVGGIGVTLTGLVNNAAIDTWNGVGAGAVTDGAVTGTLSALTRTAGEDVGTYGALTGAVTLSASNGNYLKSFDTTNSPRLAIGQAPLTFALTTPLQTKQYGDNDPAVGGIGVTLTGLVNNAAIDTWNGVGAGAVTDGAVTGTLSALTRTAGEDVGTYGALTGAVTLSASNGNYLKSFDTTNSPRLAIGQAPLTFALTTPLQTKQYGDNDPAVGGIGVTLTGLVNNAAIDTWNGVGAGAVTDGAVTGTLSALTRTAGEDVGTYGALTGAVTLSASNGNYLKSFDTTNSPRLAIGQAPLTFALTTPLQTKQYGDNDPAVGGIGVTLTGLVNNAAIDTWNGVGAGAVTDGAVTGTLSALTRTAGEDVGTYGALTGAVTLSASNGNYLKSFDTTNSPRLAIGQAPLTFALTTPLQTKQYGDNDPAVGGIGVTLTGLVNNAAIDTWNGVGAGAVTDGAVTGTLSALTRTAGEDVGTYGALTGAVTLSASNGNYLKSFDTTNSPRLAIGQAPLTFALTTPLQTKQYGDNDPAVGGIGVTLTGLVNNAAIDTWNGVGAGAVTDGAVTGTLSALTRTAGEDVGTYGALTGAVTLSASNGNYLKSFDTTNSPRLAIGQAPLTFALTTPLQTKQYGDNDPAVGGIGVTLTGLVNNAAIDTWNGVGAGAVTDGAVTGTLSALTRTAGEDVGTYGALTGAVTLSASNGNYLKSFDTTNSPRLAIGQAPLTFALTTPLQTKQYGDNDPAVGGIGVTLTGLVNNAAIDTWNGVGAGAVTDGAVTGTLSALTRTAGEDVGTYGALTGAVTLSASNGNYLKSFDTTNSPRLAIGQAPLTVDLTTNASKNYGTSDPSVNATTPTFTGRVNTSVTDWNGASTLLDDTAAGNVILASLTRSGGENGGSYNILTGTAGGTAIGNYTPTVNTNGHTLAITPVALAVTAGAQIKTYGAADPVLTFGAAGLVSATVTDWNNGSTTITDTIANALGGGLVRAAGETVLGGPYAINQGTLAANGNYSVTSFTPDNLTIAPTPLSVIADDATRLVNQPNPPFSASYSGFQFGETPAVLTGTLSFSTTATIASAAGSYPITPFGQSSTNYAITYVDGNLAVTSGAPVVPSQPPASNPDAINLVVGGFYQLGDGVAQRSLADCSSVSVWAPWACGNQNTEPVVLVAAPAVTGAPALMETGAAPQPALEVAAVPALRPTPELATTPGPQTPRFNDVMTAVMHRDRAAVVELLDFGWWVDRPDSNGLTPLMAAALNGDATITELLLQRGADPNRRAAGKSVLDYAARGGDSKVIELLRRAGAR